MNKKPDYIFLFSLFSLLAIGTIMVFSASPIMALKYGDAFYFFKRHLLNLLIGFGALYFGFKLELKTLKTWAPYILILSFFLLFLVHLPGVGKSISGGTRWINLGIFTFQPSEFMKFALILFLASVLAKKEDKITKWQEFLPLVLLIGLVSGIILKEPDMGTAITIALTSSVMLFIAGASLTHLSLLAAGGIGGIIVLSLTSAYRLRRLFAYLDPWKDPLNVGFQIIQSLLAVGSGGIFGLGLGASRQKFLYLPQQFTDFIFAILCEELGLIGGMTVILLFVLFIGRGIKAAREAKDSFSVLLAGGIVSAVAIQAFLNLFVVTGIIPTTGIPLPFISYGGSSIIITLFAVGLLTNIGSKPHPLNPPLHLRWRGGNSDFSRSGGEE